MTLTVLDGAAAAACLARALDPAGTDAVAGLAAGRDRRAVTLAQPLASHPGPKGHR